MKTILYALLICASPLALGAQSIADVLSLIDSAKTTQTLVLTVTASQGDGTVCTLTKFAGAKPYVGLKCVPGDKVSQITQSNLVLETTVQTLPWGYGDVLCLLAANPTAAAVTLGSLGSIPAASLAWQCSTNIETGGIVTGQTVPVAGTVSWP